MRIVVAGAGIVGRQVIAKLVEHRHDVVVVDMDHGVCEDIFAETGAVTVTGDATRLSVLEDAGAAKAQVVVCLMRRDADNIACSIIAKSLGAARVLARMRNPGYAEAYRLGGTTGVVRVADLLINQLMVEIEQPRIRGIMSLGGGSAQICSVVVPPDAWAVGRTVAQVAARTDFPRESLIVGVYRVGEQAFSIPRGDHVLQENDTVYVITRTGETKAAAGALTNPPDKGILGRLQPGRNR
jgi:trk system potassium uptake protein TrkA